MQLHGLTLKKRRDRDVGLTRPLCGLTQQISSYSFLPVFQPVWDFLRKHSHVCAHVVL